MRKNFINPLERSWNAVQYRIDDLILYKNNPRTHSKKQVEQLAKSIEKFGFTNPILIDENKNVIAGHGRIEACRLLKIEEVPAIILDHMTEAQKKAYVIADNKLAEMAGWDKELLAIELESIFELDNEFDLTLTGFEGNDIEILVDSLNNKENPEEDEIPEVKDEEVISRPGDLWLIGKHRILCADALKPASFEHLMNNQEAQLVFIDPPYNVPVDGHVCGLGEIKHEEFKMASGEMSEEEFTMFLTTIFHNLTQYSKDGSIHYVCMDWRHLLEISLAGKKEYSELKNLCVWNKNNGGMGSFYRSKHELVFVFKNGKAEHINNFELGTVRYRTNVWDYEGISSFKEDRMEELEMHPTVKPVDLVADAILDCSHKEGIILDCFGGSGTTLIAAEKTGRTAYLMELDPKYVDVTLKRYQKCFGVEAIRAETGFTFSETQSKK